LAARGRTGQRSREAARSPPAWTLVTPYCKRTRPGRGTNTKAAGFPPLSLSRSGCLFPPFALRLAPTHLGWGMRRHLHSSAQGPPGLETPTDCVLEWIASSCIECERLECLGFVNRGGWGCIYSPQPLPSRCPLSADRGRSAPLVRTVRPYTSTAEIATVSSNGYINGYYALNASLDVR
jgi:hypothetical protein